MRTYALAFALTLAACSAGGADPARCTPGLTQACPCPSGATGAQECGPTGLAWSVCVCAAGDASAPDAAADAVDDRTASPADAAVVDAAQDAPTAADASADATPRDATSPDVPAADAALDAPRADATTDATGDVDPRQTATCRGVVAECNGRVVNVQGGEPDGGRTYHCGACGVTCDRGWGCNTCVCERL